MSVREILTDKGTDVVTAAKGSSITDVAAQLAQHGIGALIVMDDEKVCGIASERDLIRAINAKGASALSDPIDSCMTAKVISCAPGDTIDHLMELMTKGRFRHLPVVENGKLAGIVSIGDVVKRKIEQAERDAEELKRYIAS
ncbi:MAG: CBS domain-containing protein [Rhizobiaceae bacterium]